MKSTYILVLFVLAGCASEGFMGDTPAISPTRPGGDLKVEMQEGNMICVTESNDPENQSCVPMVHSTEDDDRGKAG